MLLQCFDGGLGRVPVSGLEYVDLGVLQINNSKKFGVIFKITADISDLCKVAILFPYLHYQPHCCCFYYGG